MHISFEHRRALAIDRSIILSLLFGDLVGIEGVSIRVVGISNLARARRKEWSAGASKAVTLLGAVNSMPRA